MRKRMFIRKDEEGVSPVIATILMVAITVVLAAVLYIMVFNLGGTEPVVPIGTFEPPEVVDSTTVNVGFGMMSADVRPVDLEIVLMKNGTDQGRYTFPDNEDGQLTLASGDDVGTLTYQDFVNNKKVNAGDEIRITDLSPGSDYTIMLFWGQTGDRITLTDFSTPGY
jgi:flagellin-like protein